MSEKAELQAVARKNFSSSGGRKKDRILITCMPACLEFHSERGCGEPTVWSASPLPSARTESVHSREALFLATTTAGGGGEADPRAKGMGAGGKF